jgi:epoxyqueuosine reductase QueG
MNKFREALQLEKTTLDPISSERVNHEPKIRSENLKKYALSNGADIVGITRMREEWVFEGYEIEEPWIILLGVKMDNTKLLRIAEKGRDVKGGAHIIEVYNHGTRTAHNLANWIRSKGWNVKGRCGPIAGPVNILPAAIEAGIGVLGKHGSLINSNLGPSFRIAYVLTELPLIEDEPSDMDVDGFCSKCKLCSKRCPPNAIHTDKRLVRGVVKWYVDFDRCLPYFNDSYGCGICVAVCPWSQPGVAKKLSVKNELVGLVI